MIEKVRGTLRHPIQVLRILLTDLNMWRKGASRISPRFAANGVPVLRGRLYSFPASNFMRAARGAIKLQVKVQRANGTVEEYLIDQDGQRRIK